MRVIGFNLTRMSATKTSEFKSPYAKNTNIEFTGLEEEKIDFIKDSDSTKVSFKFSVDYTHSDKERKKEGKKIGSVEFEGNIVLATSKEETKEIFKAWKKKELPMSFKVPLFNLILKKCSIKAVALEEEVGLPLHLPIPQFSPQQSSQ